MQDGGPLGQGGREGEPQEGGPDAGPPLQAQSGANGGGRVRRGQGRGESRSQARRDFFRVPVRASPVPTRESVVTRPKILFGVPVLVQVRQSRVPMRGLCDLVVKSDVPSKREKEFYNKTPSHDTRHGTEDGTPPPHRDFKERSVVLAVAHPRESASSYLSHDQGMSGTA